MIDIETTQKIKILENRYKKNWGKEVDYTIVPKGMTQEDLILVLEVISETGESILCGYEKIKNIIKDNQQRGDILC